MNLGHLCIWIGYKILDLYFSYRFFLFYKFFFLYLCSISEGDIAIMQYCQPVIIGKFLHTCTFIRNVKTYNHKNFREKMSVNMLQNIYFLLQPVRMYEFNGLFLKFICFHCSLFYPLSNGVFVISPKYNSLNLKFR